MSRVDGGDVSAENGILIDAGVWRIFVGKASNCRKDAGTQATIGK